MPSNINNEFVKVYDQGADVNSPVGEIKNQQLNEALAAGTVESILMKSGYSPQLSYHVVVKQNIDDFLKRADVDDIISKTSFNFGWYQTWTPTDKVIQLKHSETGTTGSGTQEVYPTLAQLQNYGEIAVENWNGTIFTRRWWKRVNGGAYQKLPAPEVAKIDAGTVNGYDVQMDVKPGDVLTKREIMDLINSVFIYDSNNGSLTIKKL